MSLGDAGASELVRRSVAMILAQARQGAVTAIAMGALFGLIYVPAAGWGPYLAWYLPFLAIMAARQPYFRRIVAQHGETPAVLRRIALIAACTGWLAPASVPIFARYLDIADVGVLTIITVGWGSVAVAVLAVQPRVYAIYLTACFATVYLAWMGHAGPAELLMIGLSMVLGGRMMVKLGQAVWGQLRDTVEAGEQNASLVAQLREALQRQQDVQRSRSRFLGAASHDLRQPVQALLFLSDIFRKSSDPARRDAMAQQIVRTGESIDSMFRHLVDFAQIDAGTMKAVLQDVRLEQLVASAASGFAEKCAARGLGFRIDMPPACTVVADPVLLERMLRNFLDNAFKYSLRGEIVLRVQVSDGRALVTVADEGVGMDEEDMAQACNAFFRGRSASVAEAEGIGLGLAISRHMADLMRCRLELDSTPTRGTRVSLWLDVAPEDSAVLEPVLAEAGDAPLAGWLVAVVENDRLARDALTAWLQEAGARVAAGNSLQQLQRALHDAGAAPDLLVADFRLADGTGAQVVEALRKTYGAQLPAVVISGEPDIHERGLPFPVLQKPVTPDRLLEALRAAVSGAQWTGGGDDSRSRMLMPARAKA
ncbi:MAG TPA: hybrid sensor histidine kinase/response regulator [Ramlibacter sp.]|nr:hybrid sensor histidine kinase/response regulator [Ramlibacter sp.]